MKQPDELDLGNKWDLVFHRLQIAEEAKRGRRIIKRFRLGVSVNGTPFLVQKRIKEA